MDFDPTKPRAERSPEAVLRKAGAPLDAIQARIAGSKSVTLVQSGPGPAQLTFDEVSSLDPKATGDSDFAHAALLVTQVNEGQYSKGELVAHIDEPDEEAGEEENMMQSARAKVTVERMLEAGVLYEEGGKIRSRVK